MANQERQRFTPEEKVSILRRHRMEKVPIANRWEEDGLHPTVFYRWRKPFCEKGAAAFQNHRPGMDRQRDAQRSAALEAKLRTKEEVLAELMEEHVALKKSLGEI